MDETILPMFYTGLYAGSRDDNPTIVTHPAAKGIPDWYRIFFVSSRHMEAIILLQNVKC
jgi:hypothetical protein